MKCDRCGKQTRYHTMSWFNMQSICLDCSDAEKQRPDYQEARRAESDALKRGDFNYPGIYGKGR